MDYKPSNFAERIQTLMAERGLSRSAFAKICEVDKSNITRYCSGNYEAKQDVIYRISSKLNVNESWLMGYDVPMEKSTVPSLTELAYRTAVQQQLLEGFDRLTDINKGRVLQYVETLLENQEKKTGSSLSSAG